MSSPTLESANLYHANRLGKESWEAQSLERRQRAIQQASDDLSGYASSDGYEYAVYEQALWLMGDEADLALNNVTSIGLDGMSKGYSRSAKCPAHLCPKAWAIATGRTAAGGAVKTGRVVMRGEPLWHYLTRS